jgi:hypothetical protein
MFARLCSASSTVSSDSLSSTACSTKCTSYSSKGRKSSTELMKTDTTKRRVVPQYLVDLCSLVSIYGEGRPLRPDDETAWKVVAKNYPVTNKISNLENGYWGIMAQSSVRILRVAHPHHAASMAVAEAPAPLPYHEFTAQHSRGK